MNRLLSGITAGVLALNILACQPEESQETDLVTFPLRGKIVSVDTTRFRVTVAHEEIPDYMAEMTMEFRVKEPELLSGLEPGDSIFATLAVSRTESWLASIQVTGYGAPPDLLTADDVQMRRLLQSGDRLPEVTLLNQDGKPTRLSDFRGNVLAVTFIYTRCPLPEYCIRMSNYFSRIQDALLKSHPDSPWRLVTISFDPAFDTPAVMKSYGESYGADFSRWQFLTDPDTLGKGILRLADGLDLTYADDVGTLIAHNLRTAVIDRDGRLSEVIKSNEWGPGEVAKKMIDLLGD